MLLGCPLLQLKRELSPLHHFKGQRMCVCMSVNMGTWECMQETRGIIHKSFLFNVIRKKNVL